MSDAARCYSFLELEPGDSLEKVKQAYRDLAFVWHPDRYSHNPRLQQKASEKLKAINEACEDLRFHQPSPQTQSPPPQPKSEPPQPPRPRSRAKNFNRQGVNIRPRDHYGWLD